MISIFINSFTSGGAEKVVLTLLQKFEQKNLDLDLVIIEKLTKNYIKTRKSLLIILIFNFFS